MRDDSRTADEIERDIEREREELASNVDALQNMFSPEAIMGQLTQSFKEHGGDFGNAITRSAKQNPVALTLTGVGLAWLVFGRSYDPLSEQNRRAANTDENVDLDDNIDFRARRNSPSISEANHDLRARRTYPSWARHDLDDMDWENDTSWNDRAKDAVNTARDRVTGAADTVKAKASSASENAKDSAGSAKDAVSTAAASAKNSAAGVAERAKYRATLAKERLARGTEDLTTAARERVIAAREKAVAAAERADKVARKSYAKGRDATQDFIQEQPLAAGALAMALGAALAGALPRTQTEDRLLGEKRDDLFDEAERIFQQERAKAERVAQAAANEAKTIAEEKRADADNAAEGSKTAVEAAADEARSATKRVADAAKREAENEKLGKPNKA